MVSIGGLKARCYDRAERLLLRTVVETRMWTGKQDMQSCKTALTDLESSTELYGELIEIIRTYEI